MIQLKHFKLAAGGLIAIAIAAVVVPATLAQEGRRERVQNQQRERDQERANLPEEAEARPDTPERSQTDGRAAGSRDRRPSEQRPADPEFAAKYAVVLENNIFLRDRRPARAPAGQAARPAQAPPPAEKGWMFVGVVFDDGQFRAYFENLRNGSVTRVAPGERIANGIISEVYIDAIAYVSADGQVAWIEAGQDLTGVYPTNLAGASSPAARQTQTAGRGGADGARPGGAGGAGSIEERLRQRRAEEAARAAGAQPGQRVDPAGQPGQQQAGADDPDPDEFPFIPPPDFPPPDLPPDLPPGRGDPDDN